MRVALFGGTGFVGGYLVNELLARGHQPALLARPGSESKIDRAGECALIAGGIQDREAIRATLKDCDAAIYNIGILREFPRQGITFEGLQYQGAVDAMDAAVALGVQRFILMSANGVKAEGTPYQTSKFRAERHLRESPLRWTIFRPSVIFGDPHGKMEFCTQLRAQLIKPPIPAPLFYDGLLPSNAGGFKLAPIHIRDVANAFVTALDVPAAVGQTFVLCGPDTLSWKEIIDLLAQVDGQRKLSLPAPAFVIKAVAALLEGFAFFPITRGQITMLMQGNTGDSTPAFELFNITPTRFNLESLAYLKRP